MEGRFDINNKALQVIIDTAAKHNSLTLETLVAYIMQLIHIIREDILLKGKRIINISDEELCNRIEKVQVETAYADHSITDILAEQYRIVNETLWRLVSQNEANDIMAKLRSDATFARNFFFGTDEKGCNINSLRCNIVYQINKAYQVDITPNEVSSILYRTLWDEGHWSILDSYSAKSTFFSWLSKVAMNAVIAELEDQHRIRVNRCRTGKNTRLKLKSQDPEICRLLIEDVMPKSSARDILILTYVDRLNDTDSAVKCGLTEEQYTAELTKAESKLRAALINSDLSITDEVIRDKERQLVTVSTDFAADFIDWLDGQCEDIPLKEVFDIHMTEEERCEEALRILYAIKDKVNFTDDERYVWQKRFMDGESPQQLATEMGRQRSWVDNKYSQARKKYVIVARQWWKANTDYVTEK
jgi:hypothetical protein